MMPGSFRNWVKEQPGFVDGYLVQDSDTGNMYSNTICDSEESMKALRGHTPPGGSPGIVTDREETFDVVDRYYGLRRSFPGVRRRETIGSSH